MGFENWVIAALIIGVTCAGCAGGSAPQGTGIHTKNVGAPPTFYVSASNSTAVGDDEVVAVDVKALRMHRIDLEPFTLQSSRKLPFDASEQNVIASPDGAYAIVIAGGDYAVVKRSGATVKNPVGVAGRITGVAYDAKSHHLALFDDLGSTAALVLSPTGDVAQSWIFGPVIVDTARRVTAAAMLDGGRLALSLNGGELAIADLDASIATKAWQVRRFTLEGVSGMSWLAGVDARPNLLLVQAKNQVIVVDVDAQETTDRRDVLGHTVLGQFRDGNASIVTTTESATIGGDLREINVHFVDATARLQAIQVLVHGTQMPQQANVDVTRGHMTFVIGTLVQRYRLSDSLVVSETRVPNGARVVLAPSHIVVFRDSELGWAQRLDYARDANPKKLDLYNLRALIRDL